MLFVMVEDELFEKVFLKNWNKNSEEFKCSQFAKSINVVPNLLLHGKL